MKWIKKFLKALLITIVAIILSACGLCYHLYTQAGGFPDLNKKFNSNTHDYYIGNKFVNKEPLQHFSSQSTVFKKVFQMTFSKMEAPPLRESFQVINRPSNSFPTQPDTFSVTWGGHSTLICDIEGIRFITDPIFDNAAPIPGIANGLQKSPFSREDLPPLDFVLITHDHYDHLEAKTISHFSKDTMLMVCPLGVGSRLQSWGVSPDRIIELGWEDSIKIRNLTITAVTARHFSTRLGFDRDQTLWNAYVIKSPQYSMFLSGDGGYGKHYKEQGEKYGPFDLTCIEIGAYSTYWSNSHHFPEESIQSHIELKGNYFLPIHFGRYDLSQHSWAEPVERAEKSAKQNNVKILLPAQGKTLYIDQLKN